MDFSDHPNGKCTIIPVMDPNKKPDWKTGREWFEKLDPEEQKRLMGKTRFELWLQGGIKDLRQFVFNKDNNIWGKSPALLRINSLNFYNAIGIEAADGTIVPSFSNHALNRIEERDVDHYGFLEALTAPYNVEDASRSNSPAHKSFGYHSEIRINNETGCIITIIKKGGKK